MQHPFRLAPALLAVLGLAACQSAGETAPPPATAAQPAGPEGAPPGSCWHREVTPARIETVTEQRLEEHERRDGAGLLLAPARYRSETRQRMLRERSEEWWRIPCPTETGPEFVAALQRALTARGFYRGPASGAADAATLRAALAFQRQRGIEAPVLTREAAAALGLVVADAPPPVPRSGARSGE